MNIFTVSSDPAECAVALDDKRLNKMILETAQLLSSAMVYHEINDAPYKLTHKNHPCTIWARTNKENYQWLLAYFECLCQEYYYRRDKKHKCSQYIINFYSALWFIPVGKLTRWPNCTRNIDQNIDYRDINDVHLAYRRYLNARYPNDKRKPVWTKRKSPEWVTTC